MGQVSFSQRTKRDTPSPSVSVFVSVSQPVLELAFNAP